MAYQKAGGVTKKATFTCKVCGGEHFGLICTKFSDGGIRVLATARPMIIPLPRLAAPVTKSATKPVTKRGKRMDENITPPVRAKKLKKKKGAEFSGSGTPGRKKVYATRAEQQAAYRARKKVGAP